MEKQSFQAHVRYLLATDAGAFLLGVLLLVLLSRIRALISPIALIVLIAALAAAFGLDVGLWLRRGVRSVELDDSSLTLYRGARMTPQVIRKAGVRRVRITSRFGRRTAVLELSTFRAVRITEEAFPRESFNRFLSFLLAWETDPSRN